MRKINKLVALILVFAMALSLCACGNGAKKLYGTWSSDFNLTDTLAKEMGEEFAGFDEELILKVYVDFNEDGTWKMYVDSDEFSESMGVWMDALVDFSVELMYSMLEEQGVDQATADDMLEQQFGMPISEYMSAMMAESLDVESMADEMEDSGVYEAKGNKLYMEEEEIDKNAYDIFTVKDGVLTIDKAEGAETGDGFDAIDGFDYPFTFTKVQ